LAVWAFILPVMNYFFVGAFEALLEDSPTGAQARAQVMDTPTGIIFGGPGYGLDNYTIGAMMSNEMLLYYEITLVIGAVFLVVRGTRAEEESGRFELIGAGMVGRYAPLASTLAVVGTVCLVAGLFLGLSFLPLGYTAADSLAYGLGVGLTGLVFAALAALTAQLASTARGATGLAMTVMGVAFAARAIGDMQVKRGSALSWLSPLAWPQQTRAFVDLRWWPLALGIGVVLVAGTAAFALARRRDLGAGLWPGRPGRPVARQSLRGPLSLAARLSLGGWIGWAIGAAGLGAAVGPLTDDMDSYIRDNPNMAEFIGFDPAAASQAMRDGFNGVMAMYLAFMALWFAISTMARLRTAETEGLAELVLAGPVARVRWVGAHAAVALAGGTALLLLGGLAFGGTSPVGPDSTWWGTMADLTAAALTFLPALAATVGLATFVYGVWPRATAINWAALAWGFVASMFAMILKLPDWAPRLAPLSAIPMPQGQPWDPPATWWLTAAAAALAAIGLLATRRRDIPR
jgi:ABC-2 type transport system permease protein